MKTGQPRAGASAARLAVITVVAISALVCSSCIADAPAAIEQRYVTRWNVEPIARFALDGRPGVNAARCRIDEGPLAGRWLDGRATGTILGKTTWRMGLESVAPGVYKVTYDLRTPDGAELIPGLLRVPQIARNTGQTGRNLCAPRIWPQDRYGRIACDQGPVEMAWDRENLYLRAAGPEAREITIDLLPCLPGKFVKRITVSAAAAVPWRDLFPAIPLTGQTLRCRVEGGSASDWTDILFVGSGEKQFFGATMVSSGPGGDDQGPPAPLLAAQMDLTGLDCRSVAIVWEAVERSDPGSEASSYDWSGLVGKANLYKSGLVLCSINLQNHWAEPVKRAEPERYWKLAERFVGEAAARCAAAGVRHFTLGYNEPEMFFRTDKEDYFNAHLTHCADAVRRAVPGAVVLAGRFSCGDPQLIRAFYAHGFRDNFDVLDIHPYSDDPVTGTAMGEIVASHEALQELGMPAKRIFLGEGWGPTRKLPQVKREKWDAPASPEEADVTRQYYENGYRCLVTARADYSPDWVLGAKYFTLNDNVGGSYWKQSAKPVYGPNRELMGWMIGELRFAPDADLKPFFCNGGLIDFAGAPKGQWFYDFPPTLPEVRVGATGGPDYVLAGEWHRIEVAATNANPRPITDLRIRIRDRSAKFDGALSAEALGEHVPASLEPGQTWNSAFRVRIDKGQARRIRWAVELEYSYDGEGHVSDDIVPTEIRPPVEVSADPRRIVLDGASERKLTVTVCNNQRSKAVLETARYAGADFAATPSVSRIEVASGGQTSFALTVRPRKPTPGLTRVQLVKGVESSAAVVVPLDCPTARPPPTIDGFLSDWPLRGPGAIRLLRGGPFREQVPETPGAPAVASVAWDRESFYLAVTTEDAVFSQRYTGADVWREDSVQIALDPLGDGDAALRLPSGEIVPGYGPDDYEISLAQTPEGPQVTAITAPAGAPRGLLKEARLAVRHEGRFTVYEAAIPWTLLRGIVPKPGARFGFDIVVNDFEKNTRHTLEWAGGIAHGKRPGSFVPVVLR